MPVTGWMLDRKEREALLERFPPEWPDVIADHITLDADADLKDPLPEAENAAIVGGINDGEGLQAMVVAVDGSTDRPDGSTYHITWSLDRSEAASQSKVTRSSRHAVGARSMIRCRSRSGRRGGSRCSSTSTVTAY